MDAGGTYLGTCFTTNSNELYLNYMSFMGTGFLDGVTYHGDVAGISGSVQCLATKRDGGANTKSIVYRKAPSGNSFFEIYRFNHNTIFSSVN